MSRFITRPVDLFTLRAVEPAVLAHIGDSGRLLDIGCGRGEKTESFRRIGFEAIGLDLDPTKISEAKSTYPECRFLCGTSERLPFPDDSFDAIFSLSTLQYVDPSRAIQETLRILRPGGKGVFIENLAGNPLARAYRVLHRTAPYAKNARPRRHLKLAEIETLFQDFAEIQVTPFNLTTSALMSIALIHEALTRSKEIKIEPTRPYAALKKLDTRLLSRLPALSRACWSVLICVTK